MYYIHPDPSLILKRPGYIVMMYQDVKNKVSMSTASNVEPEHTHTHTHTHTL